MSVVASATGNVTITGDNNDNDFTVDVTAGGISITGNDRTKVKFEGTIHNADEAVEIATFDEVAETPSGLTLDLKDGDDNVIVNTDNVEFKIGKNLTVNLGDGDDSLRVESIGATKLTVGGDVKLLGGDGADRIIFASAEGALPELVLNKSLTVDLGAGTDIFGFGRDHKTADEFADEDSGLFEDDPAFFDFGIFTGAGLGNLTVKGDAKITSGEGVDAIGLGSGGNVVFQKNLEITTGADSDFLEWTLSDGVSVNVLGDAMIDTQNDSDLIFLRFGATEGFDRSVNFAKSLTINSGTGEDLISAELADLTVVGEAKINSGSEYDGIVIQNFGAVAFQKSLAIDAGSGHALVTLFSTSDDSSLSVGQDLKITTGSLTDFISVGDALLQIGGELNINSGVGSDFVGVEFGSFDAILDEGVVNSVGKDVKIDTGNGSDEVLIEILGETNLKGKVDIKTGTQSDHVNIEAGAGLTIDKDVKIATGTHSDKVTFTAGDSPVLLKGVLDFNLGNEDDGLLLGSSLAIDESFLGFGGFANVVEGETLFGVLGDVKVSAGTGDDIIAVAGITTNRDVVIDAGGGDDRLALAVVDIGRDLGLIGGDGDDSMRFSSSLDPSGIGRDLKIDAGAGNDRVLVREVLVARHADVKLGAGQDQLDVVFALLSGTNSSAKVDGGAGADFYSAADFLASNINLPDPNIVLTSITQDDPNLDQNGDGNVVEVHAEEAEADILDAINDCFADYFEFAP